MFQSKSQLFETQEISALYLRNSKAYRQLAGRAPGSSNRVDHILDRTDRFASVRADLMEAKPLLEELN